MEVAVGVDRFDFIALAESEADLRLFAGMQFLTRNYYKEQMENARGTSERLRTEKQELAESARELKKELGTMKDMFNSEQLAFLKHHLPKIAEAMNEGKELLRQVKPGWGKLSI